MSKLRDAVTLQQRGLADLQRSRDGSTAWSDDQRRSLDRECLEPLAADGRALLHALRKAADEISTAEEMLPR